MGNINFGIKLTYDGREVSGGVEINREDLRRLAVDAKSAGSALAGGFSGASQGVRSISEQLGQAKAALLGYLGVSQAADAAKWVLSTAAAMQQMNARLKVATGSTEEYRAAQEGVFAVANRWGAAVDETARTFARLNPVIAQLGGSSQTTLKMIDGLAASLRLSGASTAETTAVLLQFSQAMGSGRVGGDEFRSLMENAEPMMRAVAQQLGKTSGELRQMAEDGKLTSSVFGNALLPAIDKLSAQAAQVPRTLSQAWQGLANNFSKDIGAAFGGSSGALANTVDELAQHTQGLASSLKFAAQAAELVAAGGLGVYLGRLSRELANNAAAWAANRAAQAAAVAEQQTTLAGLASQQTWVAAQREAALVQLAKANATLMATRAMGAHSMALAMNAQATAAHSAAQKLLADLRRVEITLTAQQAAAQEALSVAQRNASLTSGLAGTAMRALGGPIGLITTALSLGAVAWSMWGGSASKSIDRVRAETERLRREAKYGPGEAGENADLAAQTQEKIRLLETARARSRDRDLLQMENGEMITAVALARNLKAAKQDLAALEDNAAARQESADKNGQTQRLSAANDYNRLTESLKTREKIVKEYDTRLENMRRSNSARLALVGDEALAEQAALNREQAANEAALKKEKDAALKALAKDSVSTRLAQLEGEGKLITRALKDQLDDIDSLSRRGELSAGEALEKSYAARVSALALKLDNLQKQAKAAGNNPEKQAQIGGETAEARAEIGNEYRKFTRDQAELRAQGLREEAASWSALYDPIRAATASLREQNDVRGKTVLEIAQERLAQLELAEGLSGQTGVYAGLINAQRQHVDELQRQRAAEEDWRTGAVEAIKDYGENARNVAEQSKRAMTNAFKGMEDALVNFVKTGKLDFASLADSIISDLIRIQVQQSITGPLAAAMKGLLGGGGLPDYLGAYAGLGIFAKGEVFASPSLHQYANTVVSQPTPFLFAKGAGIFGEAGPEAVMPLTRAGDGSLGVRAVGGGAGGGTYVSITVNTGAGEREKSGDESSRASQLGDLLEGAVMGVIVREKRSGGLLARG